MSQQFCRVRGVRAEISVQPPLHPDYVQAIKAWPGAVITHFATGARIDLPVDLWFLYGLDLVSALKANGYQASASWGWRRDWRGDPVPMKVLPSVDPNNIPGLKPGAVLQPHQIAAVDRFFKTAGHLEEIPAGGGKTLIALCAAAGCLSVGMRVLIVCMPSMESQWAAEIQKWLTPELSRKISILKGQSGCEVRYYKELSAEVFRLTTSLEEAEARAKVNNVKLTPALRKLWDVTGDIPISEITKAQRQKLVDLGVGETVTVVKRRPSWAVWDTDENIRLLDLPDVKLHGEDNPRERAEALATERNQHLRTEAPIVIASSTILTHRRAAIREWNPDVVILDECFPYNTPVYVYPGVWKPIGEIQVSDRVLACNVLENRELRWQPVVRTIPKARKGTAPQRLLHVADVSGTRVGIYPTANHKVWAQKWGYTPASEITPNDRLLRLDEACSSVRVAWLDEASDQSMTALGDDLTPETLYDIEVAEDHNYFAAGVLVSNCHEFKSEKLWKVHPAEVPGGKPTFTLHETQAASAWYVCERASAVLLLSATPDPDRRRDLWAQYNLINPKGWGSFRDWTGRYAHGRYREIKAGTMVWDSSGEQSKGVPFPPNPAMDRELKGRAQWIHTITPRSVSHKDIPPLDRRIIWLDRTQLTNPSKDPEWSTPVRAERDKLNRLMDIAAEMKRSYAVQHIVPKVLHEGLRGVVLTGSHASAERLHAELMKKLGGKTFTHKLTDRKVVPVKLALSHGGTHTSDERKPLLDDLLRCQVCLAEHTGICGHLSPSLLVGTIDAWGQGRDKMQFLNFATVLRLPWTPGGLQQLEGRWERIGGLWSVLVEYIFARNTIDERLLQAVLGKVASSLALFDRDDLTRLHRGMSEEESEQEVLEKMLQRLLSDGEEKDKAFKEAKSAELGEDVSKIDWSLFDDEEDEDMQGYEVHRLVEKALVKGHDREDFG